MKNEAGVEFGESREIGLAIGKHDFELAGSDGCAGGKSPIGEVRIVVREVKTFE